MTKTEPRGEEWPDLMMALALLAREAYERSSPLHCEHDVLYVSSDPEKFTQEELDQLDEWGFSPDEENGIGFSSFRFGSA